MTTDEVTSQFNELQREIASLHKQNEEYKRLASFPHLNPISIFEFDLQGQVVYLNPAAQRTLSELGLADARLFLPDDFEELSKAHSEKSDVQSLREIEVKGRVFEETIFYTQEYSTMRVYATDVTQRQRAEDALEQSRLELLQTQEFLEAATKGTGVLIATVDANYRYTYFNQAYQEELKRLTGKDIELGMRTIDVFDQLPDLQKIVLEEWGEVLNGASTNKVMTFGDPDRYRKTYNVLHTPIWDDRHNVVGAGEVGYDLTEHIHTQESLRESEARYQSLFEGMTEGFAVHEMIYDENGEPYDYRFLDINPAFERLTGLKRGLIIGKTYRQVLPEEGDSWVNYYGKVVISGEPVQFEEFSPTLNRHYEVFAYRCAPNQFAVLFLDVTAHKQMEDMLRVNLTKYSVLFDTLPLGVTVTDKKGHILESNLEATRLLGLSEDEQKRRLINGSEWKIIRSDKTPMPVEEYASVRAMQEQRRIEDVEMGIVKDDDQITWISVTAAPLPLKDYGIVITYNDISRRMLAEEALHKAHEKLEQTVQQRTRELQNANIELKAEIEERKRIESQLVIQTREVEARRQRFNDVLEILPVYTILLTPDYHVAFANRYFRERFGEDHGRKCYEYLFNRHEPCKICETYKVLHAKHHLRWEWTGPDGRNYDVFDYPFEDVDGSALILELGIDITDRKQAEEKLHQLNAYNRSLIEASLDALVTITPDGKIGDVNSVTETITGYDREELIGKDFHNYFTDPEKARSGYQKVFETGMVRDYELEIQHRDGHITPVIYNASIYRDEDGNVAGVFAAARDISERKQVERQLVLLTTALESAANGIILADRDGIILWSNPAFCRMTGYSEEEIVGQNPRMFKSGRQDQEFYRNLWGTILSGKVWRGEIINRRKDGSLYTEEQIITPVFDQARNITNFISIRQDITEHKQAEEALRKSEEQYRSLVSATSQIVWQTESDGKVVEDNPMWRELTGQSLEEFMGNGWLSALHPDDQERVAEVWENAVATKTNYETEYRIRNKSNEYYDFSVRGVPIKDKNGMIISWVGTCTDITEKKNYENQLIQAEKHAAIGRMVGSVTHEMNNPLQTIKNCLFLIQQDVQADSPSSEPLEMALSETQRLSNIVGQLRQLYRPQAAQVMHTHKLLGIITEVQSLISHHLSNSHVAWEQSPELPDYSINCIREQIIEVFLNICMNAIEAMETSGGILSVNLVYSSDKDQVGVVFGDTGPGVKPEMLPHIFEPFITTKEFGLGLGLSICYGIIQKHGGQITVDSGLGHGSNFTVWLPIVS